MNRSYSLMIVYANIYVLNICKWIRFVCVTRLNSEDDDDCRRQFSKRIGNCIMLEWLNECTYWEQHSSRFNEQKYETIISSTCIYALHLEGGIAQMSNYTLGFHYSDTLSYIRGIHAERVCRRATGNYIHPSQCAIVDMWHSSDDLCAAISLRNAICALCK